MATSIILLPNTNDQINVVGEPVQAEGWYGFSDGLHTIAIHVANFRGRVGIQASLAQEPTDDDWFDIQLTDQYPYLQFPLHPGMPSGQMQGDTANVALSFKANVLWLRATVNRDYLMIPQPYDGSFGVVNKIVLSI